MRDRASVSFASAAAALLLLCAAAACAEVSDAERALIRRRVVGRLDEAGIRYRSVEVDRDGRCDVDLTRSGVESLAPLRGLPVRSLRVAFAPVRGLEPLAGMPLDSLTLWATEAGDLAPLRGMPLAQLNVNHSAGVSDLSPLAGMDLKYLHVAYTAVKDLAPLRGMKLNEFSCGMSGVTDLSPLEGMPLEALSFTPSRIAKGMDAIRGMATLKRIENDGDARAWDVGFLPAEQFWKAYDCAEALRLAAVEYKRLRADETGMCWLDLSGTGLESLEALKDVVGRLAWLDISRTRVKNLEQLRGAKKLTSLNLAGAPVTDLAPLQGLALEDLQFSPNRVTNGVAAVRAMKSLVRLGTGAKDTAPPYEFWQRYDSGEFRRQAD